MGCTLSGSTRGSIELKHSVLGLLTNALLTLWPSDSWKRIMPEDIIRPLLWAAVRRTSVHRVFPASPGTPSDRSVRGYVSLLRWKPLVDAIPGLMMDSIRGILRPGRYKFAVDLTYLPYHGSPKRTDLEVVRSKAKSGTTHFHAYASLYVIKENKRFTLDILPVLKGTSLVEVLETLLTRLYARDYKVKLLFLDKGFFISPVLQFLLDTGIPSVMPVVARGRSGGVRPHLRGRRSHRTTYTMRSTKYQMEVTFPLYVVCKYSGSRYGGKRGSRMFGYAVLNTHIRLDRVFEEYRKRFGIESSYKLMNMVRARTSSQDPAFRLLLVMVALLVVNYWVASQWRHVSEPRRGGRKVHHEELRLETLRRLLDSALEWIYPLRTFYLGEAS
mgnify:CR=1 FL=1